MRRRVPRFSKPEERGDAKGCRLVALGLLARREHSRVELERKLSARAFAPAVIAATLDELERCGALAAERFTESFIRSRFARGQGPNRVRHELALRGIAEEAIAAALADSQWDWLEAAHGARVKRFGRTPPRSFAERAKQARFLEYRGFTAEQIRAALDPGADTD
jgi:regulatory protein